MKNTRYLSIDPGHKVGLAGYDNNANLLWLRVVRESELRTFLSNFDNLKLILIENYRVYPHKLKAHTMSEVTTVRVIGRVEEWAAQRNIRLVKQEPQAKTTGFSYLGEKEPPRSNKMSHAIVAHAHFTYYGVTHKIIDPKDLV